MVCEHLAELEKDLTDKGIRETCRGQVWSQNCREWVYFDCYLNNGEIRKRIRFADCVTDLEHRGTHDGSESGFYCTIHHDGIMGLIKTDAEGRPEIV